MARTVTLQGIILKEGDLVVMQPDNRQAQIKKITNGQIVVTPNGLMEYRYTDTGKAWNGREGQIVPIS